MQKEIQAQLGCRSLKKNEFCRDREQERQIQRRLRKEQTEESMQKQIIGDTENRRDKEWETLRKEDTEERKN